MLKLDLYIRSIAAVMPKALPGGHSGPLMMDEPDYTGVIPPMQLRRMSKVVRAGIWAAHECLKQADDKRPDAIIAGTGYGCLQDTEQFLKKLVEQDEHLLTPTSFIQSTHNTVAGQIALVNGCTGYNLTVSQGGHSFEGALLAAQLYLNDHGGHMVLTGGVDELTDTSLYLQQRLSIYRPQGPLTDENTVGAAAGEGVVICTITSGSDQAIARVAALQQFPDDIRTDDLIARLAACTGITHFVLGEANGARSHGVYSAIRAAFPAACFSTFKDACGDYPTAMACGFYTALLLPLQQVMIVNDWCGLWSAICVELL